MKKNFTILFALLAISCNNVQQNTSLTFKNKIIVIFDSIPDMRTYQSITGGTSQQRNLCSYINDEYEEWSFLHPETDSVGYTLEIYSQRESINFKINFLGGISHAVFPLKVGNTYYIGFNDNVPYVKNGLEHINDYLLTLYGTVYDEKISSVNKIDGSGPITFFRGKERFPTRREMKQILPSVIQKAKNEIHWRECYLDSLYASAKLDENEYRLFMDEVRLDKYIFNQNIKNNRFFVDFRYDFHESWDTITSIFPPDSNFFINYPGSFEMKYREQDIRCLLYCDENTEMSDVSHALREKDTDKHFNKIVESQFLETVFATAPWNIIKRSKQNFLDLNPMSKLPNFLMSKYQIDTTSINDVMLITETGKEMTLTDVLISLRGRDVVLDVWASWCAPCIEQIKSSKAEREKAEKEGVAYVFITFYDEKSEWLKKIKEVGLDNEKHSYFTTNSQTSKWFKETKINSIPCIITYDKKGEIVSIVN